MKTLNDVYYEITSSDENKEKFLALKSEAEVVDFVKSFGADATIDEIKAILEEKQGEEDVSEEDLKQVAGGKHTNTNETIISCFTLGTVCAIAAAASAAAGDCGTACKGDDMLCEIDGKGM